MAILKIEAFSGLSGDMFLGALADLTGAYDEIVQLPTLLGLKNVEVKITAVEKAGIACKHIKILDHNTYQLRQEHTHDHDHDHLEHVHTHSHTHEHHHHAHTHMHAHGPTKHSHAHGHAPHRHLKDIVNIIDGASISDNAKSIAKSIFQILGEAESKVHGVDINTIHFHEVGAIDSILDIVGTAYLLDKLQIDQVVSTAICTGHGFVMADHGRMPIPAPATKELLLEVPSYAGLARGEMTTPTGAAILKYLQPKFDIPVLVEKKTGHGPGEKDFEHPNVLRLTLCESADSSKDEIVMVETNIDDMSAELLGSDFQDGLLKAGAVDFYFTQVIMKKGRPGVLISVFAGKDQLKAVSNFLLEHTSTIGVRTYPVSRSILKREMKTIHTSLGTVDVKVVELPSGGLRTSLEYESCKALALKLNKTVTEVFTVLNRELQTNK
jgi:pyridinium-3,5-bisthiocarboxylic acid mononucleotide nickel chelatase